eukprot:scaffold17122_cov113-Isochrysis_galbana.AAC.4
MASLPPTGCTQHTKSTVANPPPHTSAHHVRVRHHHRQQEPRIEHATRPRPSPGIPLSPSSRP